MATVADFTVTDGPLTMRVEGLSKTVRQLSKAGASAEDLKELMHSIGQLVVDASDVPTVSGRLAATVRAGRGKTKAVVRAGGARAPYAGVRHYGWPARGIAPAPFLTDALDRRRSAILAALDQGIGDLLAKHDLT